MNFEKVFRAHFGFSASEKGTKYEESAYLIFCGDGYIINLLMGRKPSSDPFRIIKNYRRRQEVKE